MFGSASDVSKSENCSGTIRNKDKQNKPLMFSGVKRFSVGNSGKSLTGDNSKQVLRNQNLRGSDRKNDKYANVLNQIQEENRKSQGVYNTDADYPDEDQAKENEIKYSSKTNIVMGTRVMQHLQNMVVDIYITIHTAKCFVVYEDFLMAVLIIYLKSNLEMLYELQTL